MVFDFWVLRMKPLTQKQFETLEFIRAHIESNGYPPTMREISDAFGWASANSAMLHIRALERKGFVIVTPGASRGIKIIGDSKSNPEKLAQALRVIRAWAQFDADAGFRQTLTPRDVLKLCDGALS